MTRWDDKRPKTPWDYVEACRTAYMRRGWNLVTQLYYDAAFNQLEDIMEITKKRYPDGWHTLTDSYHRAEARLYNAHKAWVPNPHL